MRSDLSRRAQEVFELALEEETAVRQAFIERECRDDDILRGEVESLLAAYARADRLLEPPTCRARPVDVHSGSSARTAPAVTQTTDVTMLPEEPPVSQTIAGYRILRCLGIGGMGVVYEAEQRHPHRRVALKVLRPGLISSHAQQRFRHEADILGRLKHPGIAQVFEAGVDRGAGALEVPYFAMEYVTGARPITQYVQEERLSTRQRLALFTSVCEAVHHGHQHGVIHRDLKPGNILVDEAGKPKVIDFGVARVTDADLTIATLQTDDGQIIGTLRYMSPEQCEGNSANVDVRCDVYALGLVLYELLTGQLPYDFSNSSPFDIPRVIREEEPRRASSIIRALRGDLETIVLKAIEKDPPRRYQSALDLSTDVQRFLNNEPIEAKGGRALYVLKKAITRHKGTTAAVCTVVLLITFSAVGFGVLYGIAEHERRIAHERAEALRRKDYFNSIALAQSASEMANAVQMSELLDRCPWDLRGWEWHYLHMLADESARTLRGHKGAVGAVAFSPDDRMILSAGRQDRSLRLWDAETGSLMRTMAGHETMIACAAFSPDGSHIASGGFDEDGQVRIWDSRTGEPVLTLEGHEWTVNAIAFTPDSQRLISVSAQHVMHDSLIKVWDAGTGGLLLHMLDGSRDEDILAVAVTRDGRRIASGGTDREIRIWDARSGEALRRMEAHEGAVEALAFSPDGARLYSGSQDKSVKAWDPDSGDLLMVFPAHESEVFDLAVSPDGTRVASGTRGSIELWDTRSGKLLHRFLGHHSYIFAVAFSSDGSRLVSGSRDGSVKLWNLEDQRSMFALVGHRGVVEAVACSPDGRWIAAGGKDRTIGLYDATNYSQVAEFPAHRDVITSLSFHSDGGRLVSGSCDRTAKVWAVPSGILLQSIQGHEQAILDVAWSPDGREMATCAVDGAIRVWSAQTGEMVQTLGDGNEVSLAVAFSPGGTELLSGGRGRSVRRWDLKAGTIRGTLTGHGGQIQAVAWSPDGSRIASASEDSTIRVWDAQTGTPLHTLKGHRHTVMDVAFSPDGQRLVSASWDTTLKVWDVVTGQPALTLRGHDNSVLCVVFTPDGRKIISGGVDKTVRVWGTGAAE